MVSDFKMIPAVSTSFDVLLGKDFPVYLQIRNQSRPPGWTVLVRGRQEASKEFVTCVLTEVTCVIGSISRQSKNKLSHFYRVS